MVVPSQECHCRRSPVPMGERPRPGGIVSRDLRGSQGINASKLEDKKALVAEVAEGSNGARSPWSPPSTVAPRSRSGQELRAKARSNLASTCVSSAETLARKGRCRRHLVRAVGETQGSARAGLLEGRSGRRRATDQGLREGPPEARHADLVSHRRPVLPKGPREGRVVADQDQAHFPADGVLKAPIGKFVRVRSPRLTRLSSCGHRCPVQGGRCCLIARQSNFFQRSNIQSQESNNGCRPGRDILDAISKMSVLESSSSSPTWKKVRCHRRRPGAMAAAAGWRRRPRRQEQTDVPVLKGYPADKKVAVTVKVVAASPAWA